MKEYIREYPQFSLCGLNCGLCPRFHTAGKSACPGCGGPDFHLRHPACGVISCSCRHDNIKFCFQCASYPCKKYKTLGDEDSFITYQNVTADFEKAQKFGIENYIAELKEKMDILAMLLSSYNDGKRKNYYCLAVNLLNLSDLNVLVTEISEKISKEDISLKEKIDKIVLLLEAMANRENIKLKLRKASC